MLKSMSGIFEVYLWLVIGKSIRNNSGNCHIVGIDQIMMSPIELLKRCYQFGFLIPVPQESGSFRPWVVSPGHFALVFGVGRFALIRWVVLPVSRFALGHFTPIYYKAYGHTDRQTGWREGG